MYFPKFELAHYAPFDGPMFFALSGNSNLIIRNNTDDDHVIIKYNYNEVRRFVEYLVDSGTGTNKGIGKVGDISMAGMSYVMVTKDKDKPIPKDDDIYADRKLIKPNEFVLYTIGSNIKITATIETTSDNELYLNLELWNVPKEGITLPTTATDGFTNWLSYWFATEAVARRINEKRNKVTKFKGHHSISDIYVTNDINTGEKILIVVLNDKHPSRCLVFHYGEGRDGISDIQMFGYDIIRDDVKLITTFRKNVTPHDIVDFINFSVIGTNIKAKQDQVVFCEYYYKWKYPVCNGHYWRDYE